MTEAQMFRALYNQQVRQGHAVVRHASAGDPYAGWYSGSDTHSVRRIDALVLRQSRTGHSLWAVEIKVSVADLRRELRTPEKTEAWAQYADSFYFLVPPEMVDLALAEVPARYGVLKGLWFGTEVMRRAKKNPAPVPLPFETWRRMAAALGSRQLAEIEQRENA